MQNSSLTLPLKQCLFVHNKLNKIVPVRCITSDARLSDTTVYHYLVSCRLKSRAGKNTKQIFIICLFFYLNYSTPQIASAVIAPEETPSTKLNKIKFEVCKS